MHDVGHHVWHAAVCSYVNLLIYCFDILTFQSLLLVLFIWLFVLAPSPPSTTSVTFPLFLFCSCWVLSCIWFLLSSPVSLECFCWSLTFPAVPQGVCLCVHSKPGVCSLGCVCQWCRSLGRVEAEEVRVCMCVRVGVCWWVGAAGALWPGVSGRNSLHSQGSAWDKSSTAVSCTWLRKGEGDIEATDTHTYAQKQTHTQASSLHQLTWNVKLHHQVQRSNRKVEPEDHPLSSFLTE